ncbi:MAG: XRE family transcriptional regulator [Acidobacteria bacterium]|nr:MAG: XRE family transcriptional regulator [Acidobacteriota bacterium]
MKMNLSVDWFRRRAALDDKAEVSAGTLDLNRLPATRSSNVVSMQGAVNENPSPAFGLLVNLRRRKKGLRIEALAKAARIDVTELIEIERNLNYVPEPRTVYQLANALQLPSDRMLELSGNLTVRDSSLGQEAVRFAARSESVEKLSKEESRALEEFVKFLSEK